MIEIKRTVITPNAYGCWFCLHIFSTAIFVGSGMKGRGPRLEIWTQSHTWRWSKGYKDKDPVETASRSRSYAPPLLYVYDVDGRLWKGRTHPDENLHWSRLEGFTPQMQPIWVLRRTDPPDGYTMCDDLVSAFAADRRRQELFIESVLAQVSNPTKE